MTIVNKKEPLILFLGDIIFFIVALWITLFVRYFEIPTMANLESHMAPFSILFVVWVISFYVAGLYKKHTLILKSSLPKILFNTQITNIFVAILFFYFIPYFSIAPKTNLFIYLVVSSLLIYSWRLYIFNFVTPRQKQNAILISRGEEMRELEHEINNNDRYSFNFSSVFDLDNASEGNLDKKIIEDIEISGASIIVANFNDNETDVLLPKLYKFIFMKAQFIDTHEIYEYIFDRVPLSMTNYSWFIENIHAGNKIAYDFLKRSMDLLIATFLFIITLILYPFVALAIWLETKTNPFIVQERVGKDNKIIKLYKFRSMTSNDNGKWVTEDDNRITKVGKVIRGSRIDELPQLINVLKGDISLIGPRPDIKGNFDRLENELPYYTIRNVVKPGLSGWAQTHQEIPPQSIEETKIRLSYDLFYIKNRSFVLDIKIALQTLKTLISRTGK
jgi:lipopolysaccharide/colanic/teichoic acid biosynthesis glycosyltransferase